MKNHFFVGAIAAVACLGSLQADQKIYLDALDLSSVMTGFGEVRARRSCENNPLTVGGKTFKNGIGVHAESRMDVSLDGTAVKFVAQVGVDDEEPDNHQRGTVRFHVYADGKRVAGTKVIRRGDAAQTLEVPLAGVKKLSLRVDDGGDGKNADHADWCDAYIVAADGAKIATVNPLAVEKKGVFLPKDFAGKDVAGDVVKVVSPDGKNEIRIGTAPVLCYQVLRDGVTWVKPTPLALETRELGLLGGAGLKYKVTPRMLTGEIDAPVYKKAKVSNAANQALLSFGADWSVELIARNDGVAYRFVSARGLTVVHETASVTLPGETPICFGLCGNRPPADVHQNGWETINRNGTIQDVPGNYGRLMILPFSASYANGTMCVTESGVWDHPGWTLGRYGDEPETVSAWMAKMPTPNGTREEGRFRPVREREDYLAKSDKARAYPWRVFALAGKAADLIASDIVWALDEPCALADTSWIKPGLVAWDWWNDWRLTDVDFKPGINMPTYRNYIDFASAYGIPYIIMDEGWSRHLNLDEVNPNLNLEELVAYGKSKNVGIILWAAWSKLWNRQEELCARFAKMGIKGLKIDFMERDDAEVEVYLAETARIAAKYKLLVDYHGMHKPTGMSRKYPNIVNYEGVYGLEQLKGGPNGDFPRNDCQIPFTRMVAGPLDYTPGAMLNRSRMLERAPWSRPGSMGTRAHQLALFTLFDAPLQMLCDSPSLYRRNAECTQFLAQVPTTWDDTVGLAGEVGKFAVAARRKGGEWWIGGITDWDERTVELDLSCFGSGTWTFDVFEDDLDVAFNAEHYIHRTLVHDVSKPLRIRMRTGGGWTARAKKIK